MTRVKRDNSTPPPPGYAKPAKKPVPKGRRPLPDDLRRELISVRLLPATKQALDGMKYENLGRAIDAAMSRLAELERPFSAECQNADVA